MGEFVLSLLLRFPLLGAAISSGGGVLFTYVWYAGSQDPDEPYPLHIAVPIGFWVAALGFLALAWYRKNQDALTPPIPADDLQPLPHGARYFAINRRGDFGGLRSVVTLSSQSNLRVWEVTQSRARQLIEVFDSGFAPATNPPTRICIASHRVMRAAIINDAKIEFEFSDDGGQIRHKSVNVFDNAAGYLDQLAQIGWRRGLDSDSDRKFRAVLTANGSLGVPIAIILAALVGYALHEGPYMWLGIAGSVGMTAVSVWVASRLQKGDLDFAEPPGSVSTSQFTSRSGLISR